MEKQIKLAVLCERVTELKKDFLAWVKDVKTDYVTCKEFTPVKNLVFGFTGIILVAVATAFVAMVINK